MGTSCAIRLNARLSTQQRLCYAVYLKRDLQKPDVIVQDNKGDDTYTYVYVRGPADGIRMLQRLIDPEHLAQYLRSVRRPKATRTER